MQGYLARRSSLEQRAKGTETQTHVGRDTRADDAEAAGAVDAGAGDAQEEDTGIDDLANSLVANLVYFDSAQVPISMCIALRSPAAPCTCHKGPLIVSS